MFVAHLPPDARNHHVRYKSGTQTDRQTDIPLTLLQVREGKLQHQTSQVTLSQTIKSSPQLQCCFLCHSQQLCIHMCHVRMERTEVA